MTALLSIRRLFPLTLLIIAVPACADWGDTSLWTYEGPETELSVFVRPDGGGDPLSACRAEATPQGQWEDGAIAITLLDQSLQPLVGIPAEDLWLETRAGGLVPCAGGSIADGPSDVNGVMTFGGPLRAGGHSDRAAGETCVVYYNGAPTQHEGFAIRFNSPDLDGDLDVDLDDVILFTRAYRGPYDYAVDYHFDGVVNLSDLVRFVGTVYTDCE